MKTALDFYERGKQKEADADEYNRALSYRRERFVCPECGEAVFLTGRKGFGNYFAHFKKSEASAECDRRVDGHPTNSVYERIGLPIYMRKNMSGNFGLYMGFKALPSSIMEAAIRERVSLKINGKNSYRINEERFSCDHTSLIPLDYIPALGMKYKINYEPITKASHVLRHWSDYADGFSSEGSIFTVTEQGGKKIRRGDSITTDTEYYWVRKSTQLPSFIPGIKMKETGKLILKNEVWNVFHGIFSSELNDRDFSYLTSYLRNNLKIHLLEKEPEFLPIWPPVLKHEDGYVVNESCDNIYGYISSGNEQPKVYAYNGVLNIPDELTTADGIACLKPRALDTLVNIDRKYVSNGTLFQKKQMHVISHENRNYMVRNEKNTKIQGFRVNINNKQVIFKNDYEMEYVLYRNAGYIETHSGVGEIAFDKLKNGDMIFILQGKQLICIITVSIDEIKTFSKTIQDEALYYSFQKLDKTKKVFVPQKLRRRLWEIKDELEMSQQYVRDTLESNRISIAMIKILEEIFNGGL